MGTWITKQHKNQENSEIELKKKHTHNFFFFECSCEKSKRNSLLQSTKKALISELTTKRVHEILRNHLINDKMDSNEDQNTQLKEEKM